MQLHITEGAKKLSAAEEVLYYFVYVQSRKGMLAGLKSADELRPGIDAVAHKTHQFPAAAVRVHRVVHHAEMLPEDLV